MAFLMQITAMVLGIALIVTGRAALAAGRNDFRWSIFFGENLNRIIISIALAVIITAAMFVDAAGLQSAIEKMPFALQIGAGGLLTGVGIATAVIVAIPAAIGRGEEPSVVPKDEEKI
jgi:hypothetical protein